MRIVTPITIANSQSVPTPAPFQQMIQATVTFQNGVRFWSPTDGWLYAWLESSNGTATIWVSIPSSIPANGAYQLYMIQDSILPMDGVYWGEAPQLSPTYGQYDNGASVFNFYDNFAGTSLNTSKWSTSSGGASYTVNNGLTVTGNGNGIWFYGKIIQNYPSIFDVYVASYTSGISQIRNGFSLSQGSSTNYDLTTWDSPSNYEQLESALGGFVITNATISYPSSFIQSFAWIATGSEWAQVNYADTLTGSDTHYTIANYYPSILFTYIASGSYTDVSYWVRTRAYPPNGVMPTVSFGTPQYSGELITVTVP